MAVDPKAVSFVIVFVDPECDVMHSFCGYLSVTWTIYAKLPAGSTAFQEPWGAGRQKWYSPTNYLSTFWCVVVGESTPPTRHMEPLLYFRGCCNFRQNGEVP